MAPSIVLALAGFAGFVLAGAALRSLSLANDGAARAWARWSIVFAILALALAALLLSAVVLWPLKATNVQGPGAPPHLLRAPITAIVASSGLAAVALPAALLVLRSATRRMASLQLRDALAHEDPANRPGRAPSISLLRVDHISKSPRI
jgi:hypothetical protein